MTWLEKFREEHPKMTDEEIMDDYCPVDGLVGMCPLFDGEVDCRKCWMRPADTESDGEPGSTGRCFPQPSDGCGKPESAGPDDDITVAGPIHNPDAGLTVEGPDRT